MVLHCINFHTLSEVNGAVLIYNPVPGLLLLKKTPNQNHFKSDI